MKVYVQVLTVYDQGLFLVVYVIRVTSLLYLTAILCEFRRIIDFLSNSVDSQSKGRNRENNYTAILVKYDFGPFKNNM